MIPSPRSTLVAVVKRFGQERANEVVVACGHRLVKNGRRIRFAAGLIRPWPRRTCIEEQMPVCCGIRCLIRELHRTCRAHRIAGWRKSKYWSCELKRAFYRVRSHRQCAEGVRHSACRDPAIRAACLKENSQIDRRLVQGEVIPHGEKGLLHTRAHTR